MLLRSLTMARRVRIGETRSIARFDAGDLSNQFRYRRGLEILRSNLKL